MARESKKQEKLIQAEARQAEREAEKEAARRAQEEEDELVSGLDELEMVLMRQQLRAKVREAMELHSTQEAFRRLLTLALFV